MKRYQRFFEDSEEYQRCSGWVMPDGTLEFLKVKEEHIHFRSSGEPVPNALTRIWKKYHIEGKSPQGFNAYEVAHQHGIFDFRCAEGKLFIRTKSYDDLNPNQKKSIERLSRKLKYPIKMGL